MRLGRGLGFRLGIAGLSLADDVFKDQEYLGLVHLVVRIFVDVFY